QSLAVQAIGISESGVANAHRLLQYRYKYWLKIAWGAANDLEHFRRCCLLLQALRKIARALSQFVEQPRVLDGDDCLGREVRNKLNLPVSEWFDFFAKNVDGTDNLTRLEHWYGEMAPGAA